MNITQAVTLVVLAGPLIGGLYAFWKKSVTEAAQRISEKERADEYKKQANETINQKNQEIAELRERMEEWKQLAHERSALPPSHVPSPSAPSRNDESAQP
jgi:predicted ribosome quality control (RQC) complex YloA/Tae2 family protein